jgi:hypothetical protein
MPKPGGRGKLKGFGGHRNPQVSVKRDGQTWWTVELFRLHNDSRDAKRMFAVIFSPALIKQVAVSTCRRVESIRFAILTNTPTHGFSI